MENIELKLQFSLYSSIDELDEESRNLLLEAQKISENAYAPYSNFNVGAALLLESGEIVRGSNQENAAYPSGLCAERVAFFATGTNHPGEKIRKVAVVAKRNHESEFIEASPCGSCRQVMIEYEDNQDEPIEVILLTKDGKVIKMPSVETLLPFKFSARSL